VPPDSFTLEPGDEVRIEVAGLVLENPVAGAASLGGNS
jgi:hypothetical protein